MNTASLTDQSPGQRDSKGRYKLKVSATLQQEETRKKDRERKRLDQKLKVFYKFAKFSSDEEGFQFFSVFVTSHGETHYAGTSQLVKRFHNNESLLNYNDSMIESRTESLVSKLLAQRQKRAVVRPSPSTEPAPSQMTFLPGMGLAGAVKEELLQLTSFSDNNDSIEIVKKRQYTRRNRKLVKSKICDLQE